VRVTGTTVMAIGDSVMLASAPELAHALPGISINAKVSRAMIAGVSIVDQLARTHRLRQPRPHRPKRRHAPPPAGFLLRAS
jgi:hypothetical protein